MIRKITNIFLALMISSCLHFQGLAFFSHFNIWRSKSSPSGPPISKAAIIPRTDRQNVFIVPSSKLKPFSSSFSNIKSFLSPQQSKAPPMRLHRKDNIFEKAIIGSLTFLLAFTSHELFTSKWYSAMQDVGFEYKNFVLVTKSLISKRDKTIAEVSSSIVQLLNTILPGFVKFIFKKAYQSDPKFICTSSSLWFNFGLIEWLVGPSERFNVTIPLASATSVADGTDSIVWQSGVKLTECRFLSESKCKSACVNLCKIPCQTLFEQELGIPLYMKPNYTDSSCEFFFGMKAPPIPEDPAFNSPCFSDCSVSNSRSKSSKKSSLMPQSSCEQLASVPPRLNWPSKN